MTHIARIVFSTITFLSLLPSAIAQNDSIPPKGLIDYLQGGSLQAEIRNYLMHTDNQDRRLSDAYANALGAALQYQSMRYKGWQVGFTGSFVYNTWSSDLGKPDSLTGQFNRYEIGLFDLNDPYKAFIGRVDELYLAYHFGQSLVRVGKQKLNTPWLNPQDGRMRPNFQEGVYVKMSEISKLQIEAAWIHRLLTRSTSEWLSVGESIGQYPGGITPDGLRSEYRNNLRSNGIALGGITYQISPQAKAQAWYYWVENIFHTAMLELELQKKLPESRGTLIGGLQWHGQQQLRDGGNPQRELAYKPDENFAQAWSGRIGWKNAATSLFFNHTRITDAGRFLFPREWGRDPFYTFIPRERNEGFGDVQAYSINWWQHFPMKKLRTELSVGYFNLPEANDARLNKYGVPSYWQLNAQVVYEWQGFLKGLHTQFLYVYKGRIGEDFDNLRFAQNKVNMSLYNVVFNYRFQLSGKNPEKPNLN